MAKCGKVLIWHWAHQAQQHCDPWWESEGEWHRKWKDCFPSEWQEVVHADGQTGEKHIADVKNGEGVVVELQNSPIPLDELASREAYYKRMVWIVNGIHFADKFHVLTPLPPPGSPLAKELAILSPPRFPLDPEHPDYDIRNPPTLALARHRWGGSTPSEGTDGAADTEGLPPIYEVMAVLGPGALNNPRIRSTLRLSPTTARDDEDASGEGMILSSTAETLMEIRRVHEGHYYLDWRRPRAAWLSAKAPVFVDLGNGLVCALHKFQGRHLCVKVFTRSALARALGGTPRTEWIDEEARVMQELGP